MTAPQGPNQPWQPPHNQPGPPPQYSQQQYPRQWQPPMYGGYQPMGAPQTAGYISIRRPIEVNLSFAAWLAGAIASLVLLIMGVVDLNSARGEISDEVAGGAALKFGYLFLGLWAVSIGGFVLFAFFMRAGQQWARITLSGLTVLSLLMVLAVPTEVLSYVIAGCALLGNVLFYLPKSNAYFRMASTS